MEKKTVNTDELPEKVTREKEHFQHPQTASTGPAIYYNEEVNTTKGIKEKNKTKNEEGLNQSKSAGEAGPFEGLEDHSGE